MMPVHRCLSKQNSAVPLMRAQIHIAHKKRYNIAATRQVVIKELWQGVENLVCTTAAKQQNTQQNTLPLTRKSFTRTATFSLANDGAADVIFAAVKHSVINWPHLEFHHLSCERNKNA